MKNIFILALLLLAAGCIQKSQTISDVQPTPAPATPIVNAIQPTSSPDMPDPEPDWHIAVRLAEKYIKENGYTDVLVDRSSLSQQATEFGRNANTELDERQGTIEARAYGYCRFGPLRSKGWTVVFRHDAPADEMSAADKKHYEKLGHAVTMDEKYKNIELQEKEFFLVKVDKKLLTQ